MPTVPAPTSATESQNAYCGPVLVEVPERGPLFATGVALSGLAALVALVAALVLAVGTIRRAQRFSAAAPRLVALLALFAIASGALLGTVNLYEPDKALCAAESWLVLVGEAVLTSALAAIVVTGRAKGARIAAAVACALVLAVVLALAAVYTADGAAQPDPCYSYSCGSGALRTAMLVITSAAAALLAVAACMAWRRTDARARMASGGGAGGLRGGATALAAVVVAVLSVLYAVLAATLSGAVDVPAGRRQTSVSASTQPRLAAVLFSAACLVAAATLAHAMLRHVVREGRERQEATPRTAFPFGPNKYLDHRQGRAASKQAMARAAEERPEDAGTPPFEGLQVDDLERELEQMAGAWGGAASAAKGQSPAPAPTPSPAAQVSDLEQMAGLWGRTSRSANAPPVARISSGLSSAQHANTADANPVVLVAPVASVVSRPLKPEHHAQAHVELELGVCAGADGLETALAESEREDHAAPARQPELSAEDWAEVGFRVGVDRSWEEYIHRASGDPFWIHVRTREVRVTPPF